MTDLYESGQDLFDSNGKRIKLQESKIDIIKENKIDVIKKFCELQCICIYRFI